MFDPSQPFTADQVAATTTVPFDANKPFTPDSPAKEGLKAGVEGFVNNLPFGGQLGGLGEEALNKNLPDLSAGQAEFKKDVAAAKEAHPGPYYTGAALGNIAPMAIPAGELGTAGKIALGAGLGAGYGVSDVDIQKNPAEAAKKAATYGVLGGGLSAVAPAVSEGLESAANRKAVQAANVPSGKLGIPSEGVQDLGNFANETGINTGSYEERSAQAKDMLKHFGEQMEGTAREAGGKIRVTGKNVDPLINNLQDAAASATGAFGGKANPSLTTYRQALAGIQNSDGSWEALQALKNQWGKKAFDAMGNPADEAAIKVYTELSSAQDRLAGHSPDYAAAKKGYSMMKDLAGSAKSGSGVIGKSASQQAGETNMRGVGLAGRLMAIANTHPIVNTAVAAGLTAGGHGLLGMGAMTPLLLNPDVMEGALRTGTKYVPRMGPTATAGAKELQDFFSNQEENK